MMQTFTSPFEHTFKEQKDKAMPFGQNPLEPSDDCLRSILNYSKNLEVKQSKLLTHFEFLKS